MDLWRKKVPGRESKCKVSGEGACWVFKKTSKGSTADAEEQGRRAGREADRTRGAGSGRALRATLRTSALSLMSWEHGGVMNRRGHHLTYT